MSPLKRISFSPHSWNRNNILWHVPVKNTSGVGGGQNVPSPVSLPPGNSPWRSPLPVLQATGKVLSSLTAWAPQSSLLSEDLTTAPPCLFVHFPILGRTCLSQFADGPHSSSWLMGSSSLTVSVCSAKVLVSCASLIPHLPALCLEHALTL